MGVERANIADADELVELRVAYLTEDNGVLDEGDEVAIGVASRATSGRTSAMTSMHMW